jgi:hypothetical protein
MASKHRMRGIMMRQLARRVGARTGIAATGLCAAAFLSGAVANADDFVYVPEPGDVGIISVGGIPPLFVDTQSYDYLVDVDDTTVGTSTNPDVVGVFAAREDDLTTASGFTNELTQVSAYDSGNDTPPIGSVFDTANFGNGFENVYADLVGEGANGTNLITDTFDTPFGDFVVPTSFDAAALIDAVHTITP